MPTTKIITSLLLLMLFSIPLLYFTAPESELQLIPFLEGQQYGYSDLKGNLIISAQYDEVEPFDEFYKYALVKQNDKWYVINRKGYKLEHAEYDCKPEFDTLLEDENGKKIRHSIVMVDGKQVKQELINPNPLIRVIKHPCSCADNNEHLVYFHIDNFNSAKIRHLNRDPTFRAITCRLNPSQWYKNNLLIAEVDNYDTSQKKMTESHYIVYDDKLNPILKSEVEPQFLNENWFYFHMENQTYIHDANTNKSIKVPFVNIHSLVDNKYLIVSNTPLQRSIYQFNSNKSNYGVCNLDFELIIDTIHNFTSQQGDYISTNEGRNKYHLFDYSGNKVFDSAKEIRYFKNTSHFIIKDSLGKSKLYTADLKLLDDQEYDDIQHYGHSKYYQYSRGEMAGILDSNGVSIIEYPCERISPMYGSDFYTIMENRKQGVIDKNRNIVIPIEYGDCYLYSDYGLFRVSSNTTNKNGLLNMDGKIVIDTFYERINYDSIDNQLYIHAERDRKWTYFDIYGNTIREASENLSKLWTKEKKLEFTKKRLHYIQKGDGDSPIEAFQSFIKKHEYMNPNSIMMYPKRKGGSYASTKDLEFLAGCNNEDVSIIRVNERSQLIAFKTDEGEGLVNFENEIILPPADRKIIDIEDHYVLIKQNKKFDFFDLNLKKLYPFSFDYADDYNYGPLRVVSKNITGSAYEYIRESCLSNTTDTLIVYKQNYGYVDKFGKIFIAPKYTYARDFYEGYALVRKKNKDNIIQSLIIDTLGNVVREFPLGVTFYNWSAGEKYHQAVHNKKHGVLDSDGNTVISFKYNHVKSIYKDQLFSASDSLSSNLIINGNEKKIYVNEKLRDIGPPHYGRKFIPIDEDKYVFSPNDHIEIINIHGDKLLTLQGQNASMVELNNLNLLEVVNHGYKYYVDPYKLIVYNQQ